MNSFFADPHPLFFNAIRIQIQPAISMRIRNRIRLKKLFNKLLYEELAKFVWYKEREHRLLKSKNPGSWSKFTWIFLNKIIIITNFHTFTWYYSLNFPSWIRIRIIYVDPDPGGKMNERIRIHSPGGQVVVYYQLEKKVMTTTRMMVTQRSLPQHRSALSNSVMHPKRIVFESGSWNLHPNLDPYPDHN